MLACVRPEQLRVTFIERMLAHLLVESYLTSGTCSIIRIKPTSVIRESASAAVTNLAARLELEAWLHKGFSDVVKRLSFSWTDVQKV